MVEDNVRIEKEICSYHWGKICGITALFISCPPIEGEPTGELIKKIDISQNLCYYINNERSKIIYDI